MRAISRGQKLEDRRSLSAEGIVHWRRLDGGAESLMVSGLPEVGV